MNCRRALYAAVLLFGTTMPSRPEIYRYRAKTCEQLAAAAGNDLDTRQRALELAKKWEEMAREAEQSELGQAHVVGAIGSGHAARRRPHSTTAEPQSD